MATVNLRNVDDTLVSLAKIEAVRRGISLKELITDALKERIEGTERFADKRPIAEQAVRGNGTNLAEQDIPKETKRLPKTCEHGVQKGWNCWQCGGLAVIK